MAHDQYDKITSKCFFRTEVPQKFIECTSLAGVFIVPKLFVFIERSVTGHLVPRFSHFTRVSNKYRLNLIP